jgi:hypothetical protein
LVCWVPHTPILRVGLEPNPHDILSASTCRFLHALGWGVKDLSGTTATE